MSKKRFTKKDWRIIHAAMAQLVAGEWEQTIGDDDITQADVDHAMEVVAEQLP